MADSYCEELDKLLENKKLEIDEIYKNKFEKIFSILPKSSMLFNVLD